MAIKTFYCKCGRSFSKQSTAAVTAYEFPKEDNMCMSCEYQEKVTRYTDGRIAEKLVCQAGENEPNPVTECTSYSLNESNNLDILSLDLKFLNSLAVFAASLEGVSKTYFNASDLLDCRKSFVVTFQKNKKGLAAKRAIVENYFNKDRKLKSEFSKPSVPAVMATGEVSCVSSPSDDSLPARKARCPYLSSIGLTFVDCTVHSKRIAKHEFPSKNDATDYTCFYCFDRFNECETYKIGYKMEMSSTDKYILGFRACAYCCNSSGAVGLVHNHCTSHSFCQVHMDERPNFDSNSICEWFNKRYPASAILPVVDNQEGCNMSASEEKEKLPYLDCKHDCDNLMNGDCSISNISGKALSGFLEIYSTLECQISKKLKVKYLKESKGCSHAHMGCCGVFCDSALKGEYCCYKCANPCNSRCSYAVDLVPFGKLAPDEKAAPAVSVAAVPLSFSPDLDGCLKFIRSRSEDVLNNYVEIGFALIDVKNKKLYAEKGYDNLVDCVEAELGMKKSTCYNLIKISEKFGDQATRKLLPEFKKYNYAQCLEMTTMSKEQLALVSSDMSKRDMQGLKKVQRQKSNRLECQDDSEAIEPRRTPEDADCSVEAFIEVSDYKVVDESTPEQAPVASEESFNKVDLPIDNLDSEDVAFNSGLVGSVCADEDMEEVDPPSDVLTLSAFAEAVSQREKDMLAIVDDVKERYGVDKVDELSGLGVDHRLCFKAVGFLECIEEMKRMFFRAFNG